MYKLFAAAQAIEFSVGCHAKWSSLEVKSNEFPLASTTGLSEPAREISTLLETRKTKNLKVHV